MADIIPTNRGLGFWKLELYNPVGKVIEIEGFLTITTAHYTIFADASFKKTLLNVPAQNVAWIQLKEE